ncbi:hypothetical protein ACOME3_007760 [Neoechinorhynchus agilis]
MGRTIASRHLLISLLDEIVDANTFTSFVYNTLHYKPTTRDLASSMRNLFMAAGSRHVEFIDKAIIDASTCGRIGREIVEQLVSTVNIMPAERRSIPSNRLMSHELFESIFESTDVESLDEKAPASVNLPVNESCSLGSKQPTVQLPSSTSPLCYPFSAPPPINDTTTQETNKTSSIKKHLRWLIDQNQFSLKIENGALEAIENEVNAFIRRSINGAYRNALDRTDYEMEQNSSYPELSRTDVLIYCESRQKRRNHDQRQFGSTISFSEISRKHTKQCEQHKKDALTRKATDALAMAEIAKSYALRPKYNPAANFAEQSQDSQSDIAFENQSVDENPVSILRIHMNADDLIEYYSHGAKNVAINIPGMDAIIARFKERSK